MDIRDLLATTTSLVDELHRKELATIILRVSKVVRNIQEAKQQKMMNVYQQALCNVFLDDDLHFWHMLVLKLSIWASGFAQKSWR